jgi:hypothetical protein
MEDQNANHHPFCPMDFFRKLEFAQLSCHPVKDGETRTLCGHSFAGWMRQNWNGEDGHQLVSCKICLCLLTQPSPSVSLGI